MNCFQSCDNLVLGIPLQDDLLAELEEMEQQELDEKLIDVGSPEFELPEVPETAPPATAAKAKRMFCVSIRLTVV